MLQNTLGFVPAVGSDSDVDWNRFDVVVIRSPWDYQADPQSFIRVLETIDAASAQLENCLELVKWNIDKGYLRDLERSAIPIVPTRWCTAFDEQALNDLFEDFG